MDQYDDIYKLEGGGYDMNNPNDVSLRQNLGYVRAYAQRMDLVRMDPQPNLCSTGYCLANPVTIDAKYLIYAPNGGQITVNLSSTPGEISLEWFNPKNGNKYPGGT